MKRVFTIFGQFPSLVINLVLSCACVHPAWLWLRELIYSVDISLTSSDKHSLIDLSFPRGLRDNAVLWLLGVFVDLVERDTVIKGNILSAEIASGWVKQRKEQTRYSAFPEIGHITGLDVEHPTGIG